MYGKLFRISHREVLCAIFAFFVLSFLVAPSVHAQTPGICFNGVIVNEDGSTGGPCENKEVTGDGDPRRAATGALLRDGIFGCRGSKYANVGSLSAVGGTYVPVNDAAVTLNTGYLVYKECMLDGVISKISQSATAELTGSIIKGLNSGRNGRPYYPVNLVKEFEENDFAITVAHLDDSNLGVMCPAFKSRVKTTIARVTIAEHQRTNQMFQCSFPGSDADHRAFIERSEDFTFEKLLSLGDWENTPLGAYYTASEQIGRAQALYEQNTREHLLASGGFYPVTDGAENPLEEKVLTPGFVVAQSGIQAITAGFRQLENADELSEVTTALWSGITEEVVRGGGGLTGLTQSSNGSNAYINRMLGDTSSGVRDQVVNTALAILRQALDIETIFLRAKEGVAKVLLDAIAKLRSAESACWDLIIPKVRAYAQTVNCPPPVPSPGITPPCTAPPVELNIATSTQFSQAVIDAQIAATASTTAEDIDASQTAIEELRQLVTDVTNSDSQDVQRAAIQKLDSMVANDEIHGPDEANRALALLESARASFSDLVRDTLKQWGDSTDPAVGWCNVNNPAIIERWFNAWKI